MLVYDREGFSGGHLRLWPALLWYPGPDDALAVQERVFGVSFCRHFRPSFFLPISLVAFLPFFGDKLFFIACAALL
jgi:hypothetical protein